jgi:hypothetical protein
MYSIAITSSRLISINIKKRKNSVYKGISSLFYAFYAICVTVSITDGVAGLVGVDCTPFA